MSADREWARAASWMVTLALCVGLTLLWVLR